MRQMVKSFVCPSFYLNFFESLFFLKAPEHLSLKGETIFHKEVAASGHVGTIKKI